MERICDAEKLQIDSPCAVTLGKFDGLHRGHQLLLTHLMASRGKGMKAVVFTFDNPPAWYFKGEKGSQILTKEEKRELLRQVGVDIIVEYPFEKLKDMEPEQFIRQVLHEKMNARKVICGVDFHFGHERRGDISLLSARAREEGYELTAVPKLLYGNREISSTYIRETILKGDLSMANALLGYAFPICGTVVEGRKLGRTFGLPTINLVPDPEKLLPPNSVYISRIEMEGRLFYGVTNIGDKPTIEGKNPHGVETYLLDTCGDFYGKKVQVQLLSYLRPEKRFESREALIRQMQADVKEARKFFRLPD